MVVQPNFISAGLNVLWPIAVALTFVFFNLVTRQMSREIDPVSIQVVTGFMAVILLAIPIWLLNGEPYRFFDLIMPKADEWPLLLGVGIAGTFGHLLMTAALRYAPSTTLAPMQYLEIPFAAAIGWIVFSDWPNWLATIGIMVTISSGLYIVYRERKTSRKV